jgi:hypothetical protein
MMAKEHCCRELAGCSVVSAELALAKEQRRRELAECTAAMAESVLAKEQHCVCVSGLRL